MSNFPVYDALKAMTVAMDPPTEEDMATMPTRLAELDENKSLIVYALILKHSKGDGNKRALAYGSTSISVANGVRFDLNELPMQLVHIIYIFLSVEII